MNDNTTAVEIEGTEYTLRRRLSWHEQAKINEREFRMFVGGRALSETDNLADLEEIEIRMNTADHNLARLQARIIGFNAGKIRNLPSSHVPILLEKISELEQEEDSEVRELREGNPTATRSDD